MWLFWILLIVVLLWGMKAAMGGGSAPPSGSPSALDILKQRYARGEIDKDEYEQKKRDLTG